MIGLPVTVLASQLFAVGVIGVIVVGLVMTIRSGTRQNSDPDDPSSHEKDSEPERGPEEG